MRIAFLAAAVALAVYLRTLAPGVTEIDSGELAAVAATLGIAHPSGYPLFSCLGHVWTLLPTGLRVISWMNALSAVLCAGSVLLLYRVVLDLLPERAAFRRAGAWVAALAFAFQGTLWSVAVVTEVHALQMFLDAALLHAVVRSRLWGAGPFKESAFLAGGYLAGLCLTNHLTSALLLPAVALGVWRRRRSLRPRTLLAAAALGLLGLSVYLFLPIRSAQDPLLDWGSPETWETFRRHVTGAQYQVWIFASGSTLAKNLPKLLEQLAGFTWPVLLLAPLGIWRARRVPGLLAGTVVMAVATAAYALGYDIHDIATYFLPTFLVVSVWIGLGVVQLGELLERRVARRRLEPAFLLLPLLPLALGWSTADRSRGSFVESLARAVLDTPRRDAVVLNAYWDALHSPAIYLQVVEGVRPDVVLLDQEHFRRSWNVGWLRKHHPELMAGLENEADRLHEQVLRFERGQPYDVAEIQSAFEALLNGILRNAELRGGAYVAQEVEATIGASRARVPDGLLFRLEPPDGPATSVSTPVWPELPPPGEGGIYAEQARGYSARMAVFNAMASARQGDREAARADLLRALTWQPDDPVARANLDALERDATAR